MLSFTPGDDRMCFDVTIVDDSICEVPPENFLSQLEIVTGDSIEITFGFTEVVIVDELDSECGKC